MRDPRLVEIDFLMDLDRSGSLSVRGTLETNGDNGAGRPGARKLYGTDAGRFRDMVVELLLNGYIAGSRLRGLSNYITPSSLEAERDDLVEKLMARESIEVMISHAGRMHLWGLRDELLRDPDLEPFGILRGRGAWDRDVFIRLRWASKEAPLSLIFIDLDNFGAVNKMHGSVVGDAVLRTAFTIVKAAIGVGGVVYRYGGEEIAVLLPNTGSERATELAESVRAMLEKEVKAQVPQLAAPQTASIGVSQFTTPVENDVAVGRVDQLMIAAKTNGKNRVNCG